MEIFYQNCSKEFFEYIKRNQVKILAILNHICKTKSEVLVGKNPINYIILIKIKENEILITDRALNPETLYSVKFKENYLKFINQDNSQYITIDIEKEKINGGLNILTVVELVESIIKVFDIQIEPMKENKNLN